MAERVQVSSKKLWSDQEVLILRTMFPSASCYECLQALPGRSWSAIQNMGRYLSIERRASVRGVAKCVMCGEVRQVGRSCAKYPGFCRDCADKQRRPNRFKVEAETTDRSLEEMRQAAQRYASADILPEIADLFRLEQTIIQQLEALRIRGNYHGKSLSNREAV